MKLSGNVLGADRLQLKLAFLRTRMPQAFDRERLAPLLIKRMRARFLKETAPDGSKWRRLSRKSRRGRSILLQTGTLYDSIGLIAGRTEGRYANSTGVGFRIGINSLKYTETHATSSRTVDTAIYGRAHQTGDGYVPKRRFIGINAGDRTALIAKVRTDMRKILLQAVNS